jgi:hypothetical protein
MPLQGAVSTSFEHQLTLQAYNVRFPMPLRRPVITHAARFRHHSVAFRDERVVADERRLSGATRTIEESWGADEFPHVVLVRS